MKAQEYALIIILGLVSLIAFKGCQQNKLEKELRSYQDRLDNQWDSTLHYKDKFNKEHAVAERITVEKYALQNELKWISEELKIKPKQIKGTTRVVTNIDTFFKVDSFYQDPYIQIVKIKDTVKLKLTDTLQVVDYWKRKWILSSKKYYVDIKNSNPYVKTTSILAREIKVKKPTILIGPSVNFNGNLSVGISILYYPLTLKL
jgi:hypothetical protein